MIIGTDLAPALKDKALRSFTNRHTRTNIPYWASNCPVKSYKLEFDSDADWLAHTYFHVKADGTLNVRSCTSYPTWPDDPWLRLENKI